MPIYQVFDRAQGGMVTVDSAAVTVTAYLRLNLAGFITPTTDATDSFVLAFDVTTKLNLPQRQIDGLGGSVVYRVTRPRDPSKLTWEAPGQVALADLQGGKYGAVSDGNGGWIIRNHNWRSDTPGVVAFRVKADVAANLLTFVNCNFFGYGVADATNRGIVHGEYHNALAFSECIWFSQKPPAGYAGAFAGKMVMADTPCYLNFTACESYNCGGIWTRHWWSSGHGRSDAQAVYIGRMLQKNLDSRMVDASGNWRTGTQDGTDLDPSGFLTMQDAVGVKGVLIEDILAIGDPVYGGQSGDLFSPYATAMAPGYQYVLRRFLVDGMYVYDQHFTGTQAVHGVNDDGTKKYFSGTNGNMGDGLEAVDDSGHSIQPRSRDTVPNSLHMEDGTVIGGSNIGGSISTGNRNGFLRVKFISAGAFRSNHPRGYTVVKGPNYAMQVWDQGSNYANGTPYVPGDPTSSTALWGGHYDTDCVLGWFDVDPSSLALSTVSSHGGQMVCIPNDASLSGLTTTNRTLLPTPASVTDALALVDTYRAAQMNVWSSAGTIVGCTLPAT